MNIEKTFCAKFIVPSWQIESVMDSSRLTGITIKSLGSNNTCVATGGESDITALVAAVSSNIGLECCETFSEINQ